MTFVLPLSDPRVTLAVGGGKATSLGVMLRAGLPVPDGFVVTTQGYRDFVAANDLRADREAYAAAPIPNELASEILDSWSRLGEGPVAVRSSATAEDLPDASFAGQQDTFLHVLGRDALLDAVRRCWASLWTDRAVAYRAQRGIAPDQVALAVVVQRMAPADAAGVLFTVHPVTGRADRVVINATWGLGEALVGGRVNPDTLVVEKATGRVLKETRGDKAVMTAPTVTGTAEVEVDAARRGARALSDEAAAALAALGRTLEALFGGPQDVEWAVVAGAPVLLQSRPVTTAPPPVPGDDDWPTPTRGEPQPFDFWTQQDMGERWPEPVTPLTWSVSEPLNQDILDGMVAGLREPYAGRIRWSRRAFGRVYMNEGALLRAYVHGFGMPLSMMRSGLTHPAAAPPDGEKWRWDRVLVHLPVFWRVATSWEKNVDRFEADFPRIDAWVDAFVARDVSTLSDDDVLREADDWLARVTHYVAFHSSATSLAMGSYDQLEALVGKIAGDRALAQPLVGGITGVHAAEMGPLLAEMAATLREAGLADAVLAAAPGDAVAMLRADPRAATFRDQLERFLRRHGHRGAVEAELRHPRWAEAPELVIEQLSPYLRGTASASATGAAARREEATRALEAKLGWWGRAHLRRALDRAHRFTRMRDNGQSYVVKLLMPVRMLLAELARRLAARGRLRDPDDAWFLVRDELLSAGDVQARADARRLAHAHWMSNPAPDALDAADEPAEPPPDEGDAHTLVGIAASRGVVTGVARVVLSPMEMGRLQPGEILVTRATDPGWTPVFATIGGAVLEIGGLLSHGAIVAREYGLPAVVNVPGATRRIVDGQVVTVDGTTGRVTIG